MHRQTDTVLTSRQPRVHAPRRPRREGRRAPRHPRDVRAPRPRALEPEEPRPLRGRSAPSSTTSSGGSSPTSRRTASPSPPSRSSSRTRRTGSELEAMRDRFVAETEADLAKGGEHVRVRAGKEFVVRLHSYGVEIGLDDPWFRARRVAPPARHREHVPRDVVEARVRRRLVLGAAARRSRAHLLAALASRLQRQAPAEGVPLPRGRRRAHGAVPVRARKPAGRAVRGRLAVAAARGRTTRPRRSSRRSSRARRSVRSPRRRGR